MKWAAKKFTHISPVWFNVQLFTTKTGEATFQIGGKQDIDMGKFLLKLIQKTSNIIFLNSMLLTYIVQKFSFFIHLGWMDDIRENNTDIKFLPRFLFNEFTKESLEIFLYSETFQQQLFNEIVDFIKVIKFN